MERTFSIDFVASSFAGIAKSTAVGSELVSTIAKVGIFNFFASAMVLILQTTVLELGRLSYYLKRNQWSPKNIFKKVLQKRISLYFLSD